MIYVVIAGGLFMVALVAAVYVYNKAQDKHGRKRASSWRHSEYYNTFLGTMEAAQREAFLALHENEQFKAYMDWTLRAGLEHIEHTGLQQ